MVLTLGSVILGLGGIAFILWSPREAEKYRISSRREAPNAIPDTAIIEANHGP